MGKSASASTSSFSARTAFLLVIAILIGILSYLAPTWLPPGPAPTVKHGASTFPASKLSFTSGPLGEETQHPPRIAHVRMVDLDQDGLLDVLACDDLRHRILWYRQSSPGRWTEKPLGEEMPSPANVTVVDIDGDKDLDILVSVLGHLWPSDERIGQVLLLENNGKQEFRHRLLLDDVRRVTDVQPGDMDADGDLDLVVAVFGFDRGEILWLENRGNGKYRDHQLLSVPGCIHVPLADYDGDGDLDIVSMASQDEEQLFALENQGNGKFEPKLRVLYDTLNFDLGTAGLIKSDLDRDGDMDLLLAAGDNLDGIYHYPQPWHGCIWFENQGSWMFKAHRLSHFGGVYGVATGDLDGDQDTDVVLVSMFNDWNRPGAASVIWLENDGRQRFRPWQIADRPIYLATVDCGDLNRDGRDDIVVGGLRLQPSTDRPGRIRLWTSQP